MKTHAFRLTFAPCLLGLVLIVALGGYAARHPDAAAHAGRLALSQGRLNARALYRAVLSVARPAARAPRVHRMLAPKPMPDVALITGHMDPFSLSQLRGQAVVLFFGARDCSGGCENVLAQFVAAKRALGEDARRVRFVMIGVDVQRDTPASLLRHVRGYDDDFLALTGDESIVLPFAVKHGIWVDVRRHAGARGVDRFLPRGIYSLFITPDGRWTMALPFDLPPDEMADEIRLQLL